MGETRKDDLLKTGFWNGGRWLRCAKIVGKSGFSTYLLDFVGVFAKKFADSARILLIMRRNYVIMRLEVRRSVSVKYI